MDYRNALAEFIEQNAADFNNMSDAIWEFAEPRFQEFKSSDMQQKYMEEHGFRVKNGLSGAKSAFYAEYGSGKPVIAFLGEFDSLSGLSQKADIPVHDPIIPGGDGHGCGHHLLGTAALAATVALKDYMEKNSHLRSMISYSTDTRYCIYTMETPYTEQFAPSNEKPVTRWMGIPLRELLPLAELTSFLNFSV
jgi:aminobenzoyl-glutamate utilization protein B